FGQQTDLVDAGGSNVVDDVFHVAVFCTGVAFNEDRFVGFVLDQIADLGRQLFKGDFVLTEVELAIARYSDGYRVITIGCRHVDGVHGFHFVDIEALGQHGGHNHEDDEHDEHHVSHRGYVDVGVDRASISSASHCHSSYLLPFCLMK